MNNNNELIGIHVVATNPNAHENSVSVLSKINVEFSADLNRSALNKSIMVFEDYKKAYNGISSLKRIEDYHIIDGTVTYANKVLTFAPNKQFNIDTRYIVVINGNVKDIVGNALGKNFVFTFNTELSQSYGPCEILSPRYGEIFHQNPMISWTNQFSDSYILQVSKQNTFEVLLFETFFVDTNKENTVTFDLTPDKLKLKEGVYYLRIKSEGGQWSNVTQFFYKETTDAVVAYEDQSEDIYLKEFLDDMENELEILEVFPQDGSIDNSIKTNIWYIKLSGKVNDEDVDLPECEMFGEAYDEEDDINDEHGEVSGTWTVIYDSDADVSYIIFTPDIIGEDIDPVVLETLQNNKIEVKEEEVNE